MAGPYLHTVRAIGSTPADTPTQIAAAEPGARAAADTVLLSLGVPRLAPLGKTRPSALAPAPAIVSVAGGRAAQSAGCLELTAVARTPMVVALTLPSGGVTLRDQGSQPTSLALRRFGETFDPLAGVVSPRSAALLSLPQDAASVAWQLQVVSNSPVEVCGLLP